MNGHYQVDKLENVEQVLGQRLFQHHIGKIDRVESHLNLDRTRGHLREKFDITGPKPQTAVHQTQSKMKDLLPAPKSMRAW